MTDLADAAFDALTEKIARDKGFGGVALGAKAPRAIRDAFEARGYAVETAPSDWVIARRDGVMAAELAAGHARAAMEWERREETKILDWTTARRVQAGMGRLAVRVGHADVLALPG